jgi:cobalt-zinc-cadmium efflux system outer membrane protein
MSSKRAAHSLPGIHRTLPAVLLLAAAGCGATAGREFEAALGEDVARVEVDLHERLGDPLEVPSPLDDEVALETRARELLDDGISRSDAARIALLHDHRVRGLLEDLGIARAELVQAGLFSNPTLSLEAWVLPEGVDVEGGFSKPLVDLWFRGLRIELAEAERERVVTRVTAALVAAAADAERSFLAAVVAQRRVATLRRELAIADDSHALMSRLREAGNVTAPQLTTEAITASQTRLALAAAESELALARAALEARLGLGPGEAGYALVDELDAAGDSSIEDAALVRLEEIAIERSLSLRGARAAVDAAAERAGITARSGPWPRVDLGVVGKKDGETGDFGLGPSLVIELPIFDRGQARSAADAARLRASLHEYTATAIRTRALARATRERWLAANERVAWLRDVHMPLLSRLLAETSRDYNAMQIGAFDVLRVRRSELDGERQLLEAIRDREAARIDLAELLAGGLDPMDDATLERSGVGGPGAGGDGSMPSAPAAEQEHDG